jgi:hypothetical protein
LPVLTPICGAKNEAEAAAQLEISILLSSKNSGCLVRRFAAWRGFRWQLWEEFDERTIGGWEDVVAAGGCGGWSRRGQRRDHRRGGLAERIIRRGAGG